MNVKVYIGALAFIVTFAVGTFFALRFSYDFNAARKVCQKCLDVSKTDSLETKTVTELLTDKTYHGKIVRLEARFYHDAGYVFLRDLVNGKDGVATGFDKDAIPCADTEHSLSICTGYRTWYDHSVDVTVVGYLSTIDTDKNPFQGGGIGFNIICVEQVRPTNDEFIKGKAKFEMYPFALFGQ